MDAMQQMRAEFRWGLGAVKLSFNDRASNAGGNMPGSATNVPLVDNEGEPAQKTSSDIDSYAMQCAYCPGSVQG